MGVAWFYETNSAPHPIVSTAVYSKAHAAASRVTKNIAVLREARPSDIDVCNVVNIISDSVARSNGNITIKDMSIKPKNYTLKGYGKDISAVNDYVKFLEFDSAKFDKQLSDVKSKNKSPGPKLPSAPPMPGAKGFAVSANDSLVEFTIVVTPKVATRKAPPKPAANAAKGGKF